MPLVKIAKIKARRGTNAQRITVTLEEGEIGYTVDTKRLFVGDGVTSGGNVAATKVHSILASNNSRNTVTGAYQHDVVYENGFLYQLSGTDYSQLTSWGFIGTKVDGTSLAYNSTTRILEIKDGGVGLGKLGSDVVYAYGGLNSNTSGLSANIDNSTIVISGANYRLMVPDNGITSAQIASNGVNEYNISSSALGEGLQGGSATRLQARIDGSTIVFSSSAIAVGTINASNINYGPGLRAQSDDTIMATVSAVDGVSITIANDGAQLVSRFDSSSAVNLPAITINSYGVATSIQKTVQRPISGVGGTNGGFYNDSIGSTKVNVVSGLGETSVVELSSAGFAIVDLGTSVDGESIGTVAIPIYRVPSTIEL